jgi:hypothetical protein
MAAQTISAILERFEAVLSAPPLNLDPSPNPFTDEAVPNLSINDTFRVVAGGLVNDRITSNFQSVRLDRVTVTIARTLDMDGYQAQRDLQDLLDSIERAVIADGTNHGYMASLEKGSRKGERPKGTDLCRASLNFLVDYDFDSSAE